MKASILLQPGRVLFTLVTAAVLLVSPGSQAESPPDLDRATIARIINHGPWPPENPPDPGNRFSGDPNAEKIGRALFHDPSLSINGKISCASCHQADHGFSEPRARTRGIGNHVRNTQGLLNVSLQRWFGWDGGTDSLWAAAIRPLLTPVEMGGSIDSVATSLKKNQTFLDWYEKQEELAAGNEGMVVAAAQAIGAWVRTLRSERTSFDAFRDALASKDPATIAKAREQYPASAQRGLRFFVGPGRCSFCHFGANFSNNEFHDIGRPFIVEKGVVDPGRYVGIKRVKQDPYNLLSKFSSTLTPAQRAKTETVVRRRDTWGQWRTPSLRNLAQTAPYMHDGSLATLTDVINYYSQIDLDRLHTNGESLLRPLELSAQEIADLKSFLLTLSPQ